MIYSKTKLKNNGDKNISLFQTILNRKCIKQMFAAYTAFATGFI
jgi:hypothetical protein